MGSPAVQTFASSVAVTVRLEAIAPHHDAGRPAAGGSATVSTSGFVRSSMFEMFGTWTARLKRSRPIFTPLMSGTSTVTGSSRTVPGAVARHGATAIVRRHPLSASRATVNGKSWRLGPRRPNGSIPSNMSNGSSAPGHLRGRERGAGITPVKGPALPVGVEEGTGEMRWLLVEERRLGIGVVAGYGRQLEHERHLHLLGHDEVRCRGDDLQRRLCRPPRAGGQDKEETCRQFLHGY